MSSSENSSSISSDKSIEILDMADQIDFYKNDDDIDMKLEAQQVSFTYAMYCNTTAILHAFSFPETIIV
eukprot:5117356-Ditylum_brightwellii.AAC.1